MGRSHFNESFYSFNRIIVYRVRDEEQIYTRATLVLLEDDSS